MCFKTCGSSTDGHLERGSQKVKVSTVQALTPLPICLHAGALVEMISDQLKILFVFEIWLFTLKASYSLQWWIGMPFFLIEYLIITLLLS